MSQAGDDAHVDRNAAVLESLRNLRKKSTNGPSDGYTVNEKVQIGYNTEKARLVTRGFDNSTFKTDHQLYVSAKFTPEVVRESILDVMLSLRQFSSIGSSYTDALNGLKHVKQYYTDERSTKEE